MRSLIVLTGLVGASISLAAPAAAQTNLSGEELHGQTVDVLFSDGTRNAVFFGGDGNAVIAAPSGLRSNGTWSASGGKICLNASGASECWDYVRRFTAGQAVTLNSSCNETSQWTARSVNAPVQQVAPAITRGERG